MDPGPTTTELTSEEFSGFVREAEPRLRRALVATYGGLPGRESTAEALAYAWEHWDRIKVMDNPVGYLYRVAQSRARGQRRSAPLFPPVQETTTPWVEPGLPQALRNLSMHQRVAVVLAHGFGWTHREIAELLGISSSTVQNHVERALTKLRTALEVSTDG